MLSTGLGIATLVIGLVLFLMGTPGKNSRGSGAIGLVLLVGLPGVAVMVIGALLLGSSFVFPNSDIVEYLGAMASLCAGGWLLFLLYIFFVR